MAFDREHQVGSVAGRGARDEEYSAGRHAYGDGAAGSSLGGGYAEGGLLGGGLGPGARYTDSLFADLGGAEISVEGMGGGDGGEISGGDFGMDAEGPGGSVETEDSPVATAEAGFAGTPRALPHLQELERQFGMSLEQVQAFTDENAQVASSKLGAHAYASGHQVAFGTPDPSLSLVAHELTHVIQHTSGRAGAGGGEGIDKAGEGEAERVEAAVAAGRPARSALDVDPRALGSAGARKPGPALKARGQRPALSSSPWSSGFTVSPTGLEQSGSYRLWQGTSIPVPLPLPPVIRASISPQVQLSIGGGVDWSRNVVQATAGVTGSLTFQLASGVPELAEVYANMQATASGRFRYERGRDPSGTGPAPQQQRAGSRRTDNWSLAGSIVLGTAFNVGVKLGGGIINKRFQFGRTELGRLTGIEWRNGRMTNAMRWQWGPIPQSVFREISRNIERARQIMRMGRDAAAAAWREMSEAGGWVLDAGSWVARQTGRVVSALNPFD